MRAWRRSAGEAGHLRDLSLSLCSPSLLSVRSLSLSPVCLCVYACMGVCVCVHPLLSPSTRVSSLSTLFLSLSLSISLSLALSLLLRPLSLFPLSLSSLSCGTGGARRDPRRQQRPRRRLMQHAATSAGAVRSESVAVVRGENVCGGHAIAAQPGWLPAALDAVAGERAVRYDDVYRPAFRVFNTTCWSCTQHVGSSIMTPTRTPAPAQRPTRTQCRVPTPARPAFKVARCGGSPLIRCGAGDATPTLRTAHGHRLRAVCSSAHTDFAAPARTPEHGYLDTGQ